MVSLGSARSFLVALATVIAFVLLTPSIAEAKPKPQHHAQRAQHAQKHGAHKRVVKHPWARKSPPPARHAHPKQHAAPKKKK